MLSYKDTKFLFCQINLYLAQIEKPLKLIRDTVITDENYALTATQEKKNAAFYWTFAGKKPSKNRRWKDIFSWQYTPGKCYSKLLNKKYYAL